MMMNSEARKRAQVRAGAATAYDAEDQDWFNALDTDDLTYLWSIACDGKTWPAWDDEVFDALASRGFFDKKVPA